MSILILILKIIGILFLLILALAAVILFHPVYYCLEGEKEEELSARGHFWWIFKLFQLEFAIEPDDISIRFHIFGFEKKNRYDRGNKEKRTKHCRTRISAAIQRAGFFGKDTKRGNNP